LKGSVERFDGGTLTSCNLLWQQIVLQQRAKKPGQEDLVCEFPGLLIWPKDSTLDGYSVYTPLTLQGPGLIALASLRSARY